ncbi:MULTISPECIES: hypothetical protein [unclassified Arthrobacter]|uniref:hypothetical protein n=1 Tax=unclassified Arthrobacter TaxID=235627 RepID=UPI00288344C1|nr:MULTISPECIES: hypothetical protein [unclassified Arthrobacter]
MSLRAADPAINERVDATFTHKYANSPHLPAQFSAGPRTATVLVTSRLTPHSHSASAPAKRESTTQKDHP